MIVDFKSPYQCVLGRTAFATFMARPGYTYNRMKIPGPNGVIDALGDMEKDIKCEEDCAEEADAAITAEEADVAAIAEVLERLAIGTKHNSNVPTKRLARPSRPRVPTMIHSEEMQVDGASTSTATVADRMVEDALQASIEETN